MAEVLARLAASKAVAKFARQLARKAKLTRKPLRETALATMWHHPTARPVLEQMLQLPEGPCFSIVFEQLDRNEDLVRAWLLATLHDETISHTVMRTIFIGFLIHVRGKRFSALHRSSNGAWFLPSFEQRSSLIRTVQRTC